jgi:hypothetical protein
MIKLNNNSNHINITKNNSISPQNNPPIKIHIDNSNNTTISPTSTTTSNPISLNYKNKLNSSNKKLSSSKENLIPFITIKPFNSIF